MPEGEGSGAFLAQSLNGLLGGSLAPEDRESAWQDSLDLLALAAFMKTVALIGCGYHTGGWLPAVAELAAGRGLAVRRGGVPWLVREEFAGLPEWYAGPVRDAWRSADMLTVCRPQAVTRFGGEAIMVGCEEEAELLGYPACCVTDHHTRRRIYHDLMIDLIAARCEATPERRRLAESEAMPSLRDDADRCRLEEALRGEALAFAGFVPCPVCQALGPRGPAGQIDLAMRELAHDSGLPLVAEG